MFARHWFRLLALVLYVGGVGIVLHQCARQFNPPQPPAPKERPEPVPDAVARQQRELAEQRTRHETEIRRRKAAHHAYEAELTTLRQTDLPRAMGELASNALRYQNKLSDLARLEPAARWERETPVKDARAHAYRLVLAYQDLDREAQKERDGPTIYQDADIALFSERLGRFRTGGEGIATFADAVPVFAGQVPETLVLQAIDAITVAVLPADAFDPCRNPAACPKEPPQALAEALPFTKEKRASLRVVWWARHHDLILRLDPDTRKPNAGLLSHGQLVEPTGRISEQSVRNAVPIRWVEIKYHGATRWALESILEKAGSDASAFDWWSFGHQRAPAPSRRSRKRNSDFFSGLFGN